MSNQQGKFAVIRNEFMSLKVVLATGYHTSGTWVEIFRGSISECREFVRNSDI